MIELWNNGYFNLRYATETGALPTGIGILAIFLVALGGYLLGSINASVIYSKKLGVDIRSLGSKNAGATNMYRILGKKAFFVTLLFDVLKTVVAQLLGRALLGIVGAFLVGIFCIFGHAFPLYFHFRGGKGVVCFAVMCAMTTPVLFLLILLIFGAIVLGFKMVSLGSVMCALVYPLMLSKMTGEGIHVILGAVCSLLILFLHRKNIVRIYRHEEAKISFGKKDK